MEFGSPGVPIAPDVPRTPVLFDVLLNADGLSSGFSPRLPADAADVPHNPGPVEDVPVTPAPESESPSTPVPFPACPRTPIASPAMPSNAATPDVALTLSVVAPVPTKEPPTVTASPFAASASAGAPSRVAIAAPAP